MTNHVFISYVTEDKVRVGRIRDALQAANIGVWMDRDRIYPGFRWKAAISKAIEEGAFFLACFSENYWKRNRTYMRTELGHAIEIIIQTQPEKPWFIGATLDDCPVPNDPIGGIETLKDIQYVNLYDNWGAGMSRIIKVISDSIPAVYSGASPDGKLQVAEEFRIDRALRLYDQWHSPLVHESRIQVSNFLELVREGKIAGLPTLSEFELAQRSHNSITPYADHFFRVIHFLETWAFMRADNLLDHALLARLLGSYVKWYRARLVVPAGNGESNPDFVNLLQKIDAMASSSEIETQGKAADPSTDPA